MTTTTITWKDNELRIELAKRAAQALISNGLTSDQIHKCDDAFYPWLDIVHDLEAGIASNLSIDEDDLRISAGEYAAQLINRFMEAK